jgi:hypothetical protein
MSVNTIKVNAMNKAMLSSDISAITFSAARISMAATVAAIIFLTSLHILSPEFDPSWRMVSEYALGNYNWVLSLMFITWAIGAWALFFAIRSQMKTIGGKIGLGFLIAAGIGEAMASVFDVNHPLHGVAAMIGIPSLSIAAILISISLGRNQAWQSAKKTIMLTAHLTWISILIMAVSVMLLFSGFSKAGVDISSGTPPAKLPEGVIAFAGWANRLLIIVYCIWVITVARKAIQLRKAK